MSDPEALLDEISRAEDAFGHAHGEPTFESPIDSSPGTPPEKVQIQKACRALELINALDEIGEYYSAILEHSFIIVEQTILGYLLANSGIQPEELRDHETPYRLAKGRVPLQDETINSLHSLYAGRRTEHYYGTTVTTKRQAESMRAVARALHDHIVQFDTDLTRYCNCTESEG